MVVSSPAQAGNVFPHIAGCRTFLFAFTLSLYPLFYKFASLIVHNSFQSYFK